MAPISSKVTLTQRSAVCILREGRDHEKTLEAGQEVNYKGLFEKDPSYRVQAEALAAIGKTGDPSAAPFLKRAMARPSYRDMVRRAAETALKLLEDK